MVSKTCSRATHHAVGDDGRLEGDDGAALAERGGDRLAHVHERGCGRLPHGHCAAARGLRRGVDGGAVDMARQHYYYGSFM